MPVTTTPSHGFTVGADGSLTISHTSDTYPLYVLLSWFVPLAGVDSTDVVTGVTFNGTALTRGGREAVEGNTIEWWRLDAPDSGTHDVVISLNASKRICAGVVNLRGWPRLLSDHTFAADGFQDVQPSSVSVDSRVGAEVISWLSFNNANQDVTAPSGSTELWNEEGMNVTGGDPALDGDQRSAGAIQPGADTSVAVSWAGDHAGTGEEVFGLAALSFTVGIGRHLISGTSHTVSGINNVALGSGNTVNANGSQTHGEAMSVTGDRSIGINLTDTPRTLSDPNTFELWADTIRLHGAGAGVGGPGSSTDNAIARFDGTAGDTIQNSTPTVEDDGRIANLTDPSGAQDAATKNYVDGLAANLGKRATAGLTIDGAGAVITTGVKGFIPVPITGTIVSATLLSIDAAATAGSIVIDVWKDSYANFPPTVADSITASAKPTLSSANKSKDTTLTGWTTAVTAGDILGFNVDSVSTLTRVVLALEIES